MGRWRRLSTLSRLKGFSNCSRGWKRKMTSVFSINEALRMSWALTQKPRSQEITIWSWTPVFQPNFTNKSKNRQLWRTFPGKIWPKAKTGRIKINKIRWGNHLPLDLIHTAAMVKRHKTIAPKCNFKDIEPSATSTLLKRAWCHCSKEMWKHHVLLWFLRPTSLWFRR